MPEVEAAKKPEAETITSKIDKELEHLIKAKYSLLYVVSWEEHRVISALDRICDLPDINLVGVHVWDSATGLRTSKGASVSGGENLLTPDTVLEFIMAKAKEVKGKNIEAKANRGPIFVLNDMFRYFGPDGFTPELERKFRVLGDMLRLTNMSVVVISPVLQLPTALEKSVTVLDYPMPAAEEMSAAVKYAKKKLVERKRITQEEADVVPEENVVRALLGLTKQEADDAMAKAIIVTRQFDIKTILDIKRQIVRKGQLLDYIYSEDNLDCVGGFLGLKEFINMRKAAFTDRAKEYGLPSPKGIFMLGIQGCGKSLAAKAIANELQVPLLKLEMGRLFGSLMGESLAPDEEIITYQNGTCERGSIEELCNKRPAKASVETYSRDMRSSIGNITGYVKHKRKSRLVEVILASGRKVRVTEDHSLFTLGPDGKMMEVSPIDMEKGSSIAVPIGKLQYDQVKNIDIVQAIYHRNMQCKWFMVNPIETMGKDKITKIVGKSNIHTHIYGHSLRLSNIPQKQLPRSFDLRMMRGAIIPSIFNLTPSLMEVFGWSLAEGSIGRGDNRLSIHRNEVPTLEALCKACDLKTKTYYDSDNLGATMFVHGRAFGQILGIIGMKDRRVPAWVFGTSLECRRSFVRGYFSGDGGISGSNIEASTAYEKLAGDMLRLLGTIGIFASAYPRQDGGYRISISSGTMKQEFAKHIGFSSEKKNKALALLVPSERDTKIPKVAFVREAINKARNNAYANDEKVAYGGSSGWVYKHSIENILPETSEWQVVWDKVKEIRPVLEQPTYVYDISVAGTESFVSGLGGVICHNSESNIKRAIQLAESVSPCVLFMDEIDKAIAGATGASTDSGTTKRVIANLLDWMNDKTAPVFVVAAANSLEGLPPAVLRKGRFDELFFVDLPDPVEREAIFNIHIRKRKRDPAKFDIKQLVGLTDGYSGAEIEGTIVDSMFTAFSQNFREFETKDIVRSIKTSIPLSTTMKEDIDRLRETSRGKMRLVKDRQSDFVDDTGPDKGRFDL